MNCPKCDNKLSAIYLKTEGGYSIRSLMQFKYCRSCDKAFRVRIEEA
ncbi:hypothetical protein KAR91_58575 [Candidatus Pacearchaeota archaeon]|nr:hypothetical protein [Candidatus Pacearchaeota archaeon]